MAMTFPKGCSPLHLSSEESDLAKALAICTGEYQHPDQRKEALVGLLDAILPRLDDPEFQLALRRAAYALELEISL